MANVSKMSAAEMLEMILKHPTLFNTGTARKEYLTEALWQAHDILPEGKGKRALHYVASHPSAGFYPGGTDAVCPAIREAVELLYLKEKKERAVAV